MESDKAEEFILRFLARPVSAGTLDRFLRALHDFEGRESGPRVFKPPYLYWQENLDAGQKTAIEKHLTPTAKLAKSDLKIACFRLAILMRLHPRHYPVLSQITKSIPAATVSNWPEHLLIEIGSVFRAVPDWQSLEAYCSRLLDILPTTSPNYAIVCDWLILASFRLSRHGKMSAADAEAIDHFADVAHHVMTRVGQGSKNSHFYASLLAGRQRNLEQAVASLLEAQCNQGKTIPLFQRLENFVSPQTLSSSPGAELRALWETLQYRYRHQNAANSTVLLVSVDQKYFDRYLETFLSSVGQWNRDLLVHIHCINFDPAEDEILMLEKQSDVRINLSLDQRDAITGNGKLFPGYCAGSRFIFLPALLARYERIVSTDVDGVIVRSFAGLWEDDKNTIHIVSKLPDRSWQPDGFLWETIAAGAFAITHSPANMVFANMVANYLAHQLEVCSKQQYGMFYTDQVGLLLAYLRTQDSCQFRTIPKLFDQGGDWRFAAEAGSKKRFQSASVF